MMATSSIYGVRPTLSVSCRGLMPLVLLAILTAVPSLAQQGTAKTPKSTAECTSGTPAMERLAIALQGWNRTPLGSALRERDSRGEIVLIQGDTTLINAATTSPDFGKSRNLAFAKAFLNAQAKFIRARSSSISTKTASEFLNVNPSQADLSTADESSSDVVVRIGEKAFALTEAKLDAALRSQGVPEEDIRSAPKSKKVDTFRDNISRTSVSRAFNEVSGFVPVLNMEAIDCNNLGAVAVIAVYSEKTRDFSRQVIGNKPIFPDIGSSSELSVFAQVDGEIANKEIVNIVGLRQVRDQDGYPVLLGYGQWSFVTNGLTAREAESRRKAAMVQARANAQGWIASFLNGQAQASIETVSNETEEHFIRVSEQGQNISKSVEIVEKQLEQYRASAKITLTGIRELAVWSAPYPGLSNIKIVGSVMVWSPKLADAVGKATGGRVGRAAGVHNETEATTNIRDSIKRSKVKNDAADF